MSNKLAMIVGRELQRLPPEIGFKPKDEDCGWLRCPYHGGGKENTPSLKINLKDSNGFNAGSFVCFGCGETGQWDKFAKKFKLKGINKNDLYNEYPNDLITDKIKAHLFDEEIAHMPEGGYPWPKRQNWRNIEGKLVSKIGSVAYYDLRANKLKLFFPVHVHGELVGGVKANIIPEKKNNYLNTEGGWVKKLGLFPYDLVSKMDCSAIMLVEGARDALNLIQHGMPALAILGTGNWTAAKGELIMSLGPKTILRALDNDPAGNKASKVIKAYFSGKVGQHRVKLPDKKETGEDASDMSIRKIETLKKHFLKKGS